MQLFQEKQGNADETGTRGELLFHIKQTRVVKKYVLKTYLLVGVTEIGSAFAVEAEAWSHRAPETRGDKQR